MPVCSFCKQPYEFPKGTTVIQKDGNIRFFCSSKCRKNSEMGRDNKKVGWIRKSEIVKEEKTKKIAQRDARLELEKEKKIAEKAKKAASKAKKAAKKK
jgi:large subunit ribosomal protein L24e